MKVAVLLFNLGGPENPEDVRPFLANLFADRDTIRFPGGRLGQRFFSWLVTTLRTPGAKANYQKIGGSPLVRWTRTQGEGMRERVERDTDISLLALPCMRYWHPMTDEAFATALDWGADHIVAFSQYPHACAASSGNSLQEIRRVAKDINLPIPMTEIESWHDHPGYVAAVAECVGEAADRMRSEGVGEATVLYSAHSLPMKIVDAGDPYPDQVRETVELVQRKTGLDWPFEVSWQSRVGPMSWLRPSTVERVQALAEQGSRDLIIVPISFTSDHIETLHELDIELFEVANRAGIRNFVRAPSLNARPIFLDALARILCEHLTANGLVSSRVAR